MSHRLETQTPDGIRCVLTLQPGGNLTVRIGEHAVFWSDWFNVLPDQPFDSCFLVLSTGTITFPLSAQEGLLALQTASKEEAA